MGDEPVVVAQQLAKAFGERWAVAGIDLSIPRGSFFGVVGPNGAGKTTSLRMMTGLLRPDHGRVLVDGHDVWQDPVAAKARIGVLTEDTRMFDRLSGWELLEYNGLLRSMPLPVIRSRAEELLDVLTLNDAAGSLVVDYSQGMRKKIALACALLHAPAVLFLDEPFESVDPVSSRVIRNVLDRATKSGTTVVFSSHVMETVERVCDHVAVLNAGAIVAVGALAEVRGPGSLEDAFFRLVGAKPDEAGRLSWLGPSSV